MTKHRDLAYGDRLPESLLDALAEFVSTGIFNFQLTLAGPTTIQVVAGTGNGQVGVGINGRWRYITSTINAAHPAGAAGQYDVFVTGSDNTFVPGPPEVDNTVYAFGLVILAQGNTPGTALYRKVAETTWTGSAISALTLTATSSASASPAGGQAMPSGAITQYAGGSAPLGWLLCNGASVARATYPALFAAIGTTYGSVDGNSFTLPDLRGRVVAGFDASQTEFNTLGKTGGVKTHALDLTQIPGHDHGGGVHAHTLVGSGTGISINGNYTGISIIGANIDHSHFVGWNRVSTGNFGGSNNVITGIVDYGGGMTGSSLSFPMQANAAHGHGVTDPTHGHGVTDPTHSHTVNPSAATITSQGGGAAHTNIQPYIALNHIIKT